MGMKQKKSWKKFWKKIPKWQTQKNWVFQNHQFSIFFAKISGIGPWVSRINWCPASIWPNIYGHQARLKMHFLCFIPFVEQPDDHIGWATLLPFTWIYPTDPRTNSWNFCENILRIGGFEKLFWVGHFELFFLKYIFFLLHPHENQSKFLG